MSEKLKNCPFCGSDDVDLVESALNYVTCNNCCAAGPDHHSSYEAVEAWNTRAPINAGTTA